MHHQNAKCHISVQSTLPYQNRKNKQRHSFLCTATWLKVRPLSSGQVRAFLFVLFWFKRVLLGFLSSLEDRNVSGFGSSADLFMQGWFIGMEIRTELSLISEWRKGFGCGFVDERCWWYFGIVRWVLNI